MRDRKVILEIDGKLVDMLFTYKTAYNYSIKLFEESLSNKEANIYVKGELVTTILNKKINVEQTSIQ